MKVRDYLIICLVSLLLFLPLDHPLAKTAEESSLDQPEISSPSGQEICPNPPPTPCLGFVPVVGEAVNIESYEHDDSGLHPQMVGLLIKEAKADCVLHNTGAEWKTIQPAKGRDFYWEVLDKSLKPLQQPGVVVIAYLDLTPPSWVEDGSKEFWETAEVYLRETIRHYNKMQVYYFIFGNEPNHLQREEWASWYMERLGLTFRVAKEVSPCNRIIGGNLSANAIFYKSYEKLYEEGFLSYSDIVGFHPYKDNRSGLDPNKVKKLLALMEKRGDQRPIFLGEGWGWGREIPTELLYSSDPKEKEAQLLKDALVTGHKDLLALNQKYPGRLFGAFYFLLNDNWGRSHWKERAEPVQTGTWPFRITAGFLVDGVIVAARPEDLEPRFFNGGLVDINGQPKGDLIEIFASFKEGK